MISRAEEPIVIDCFGEAVVALLHPAATATIGVLVIVGGPQYRVGSHRQFVLTARALAAAGFPVLRFDYRGMGDSDGDARSFETIGDDIGAALDAFADAVPGLQRFVLLGLCDAASASLIYCGRTDPRIAGLVLMNPWARTEEGEAKSYVRHYYRQRLLQISFWRKVFGGKFQLRHALGSLYRNLRAGFFPERVEKVAHGSFIERMRAGFERFEGPVLLIISGRDLTAKEFMDLTAGSAGWRGLLRRKGVEIRDLPKADHTFSSRDELDRSTGLCREWLRSHWPADRS